jgi:phage replication O-like protein O
MTSPQIENGYTRIANELLDAIVRYPFSRREYAVVMAIIRMTYGFNKKEDAISGWQLSEMTGIDRSHVSKTINELVKKNVVKKGDSGRISHGQTIALLSINKHYKSWETVAEMATDTVADSYTVAKSAPVPNQPTTVAETATETVAELAEQPLLNQPTHKDIPKDNKDNTKDSKQQPSATDRVQAACKETWKAYSAAFNKRYGVTPVRNPKVSSQIKQFVGRIGFEESPKVAEFYVGLNEQFYIKKAHGVGQLLADAEKLRTEWATGRPVNAVVSDHMKPWFLTAKGIEQKGIETGKLQGRDETHPAYRIRLCRELGVTEEDYRKACVDFKKDYQPLYPLPKLEAPVKRVDRTGLPPLREALKAGAGA